MRRNTALSADYARRHQVPRWYDNADALIHDPEVDIVYIATPPDAHKEITLKVAAAGKPVYVEKPMARNYQECLEMIKACEMAKVPLFTAYYRRSLPAFLKIKTLLDQITIGKVHFIRIVHYQPANPADFNSANLPWRVIPEISGGGHFVDLACHTLDLLDYFFGRIIEVNGLAGNQAGLYPAEDVVAANLKFENNIMASGVWCFTAPTREDRVTITGTEGTISFSVFAEQDVILENQHGKMSWPFIKPVHVQQPHIQTIVDQLNSTGKCPSDGYTAARTTWVMDEILGGWRESKAKG
jgi:predicted dehydrogenase